jgi:hypothetical protein
LTHLEILAYGKHLKVPLRAGAKYLEIERPFPRQRASNRIQTLRGLLPICAACKKIRNENGGWERMEFYIEHRSQAR